MRVARRRREQVVDPARVVAQHVALADAYAAVRNGNDATRFERLDGPIDVEYYRSGGILPAVLRRLATEA